MNNKHLVLFEPNTGGHHGLFVKHLLNYWGEHNLAGTLELIVTRQFLDTHQDLQKRISTYADSDIRITHIDPLPRIKKGSLKNLVQHDLRQGALLKEKLNHIRPSHALLMYVDHLQLSLGTILRSGPQTHIAGIYFRPSFHYPILRNSPAPRPNRLTQLRKKTQLKLAMHNPRLQTLFSLDPYVVTTLNAMGKHTKAVILPDGVEPAVPVDEREAPDWGIGDNRFVALCFGSLARRKGVFELLDALPNIPPATQKQLALVFAGVVAEAERDAFYQKVEAMRSQTNVQIVLDDRFVEDHEIPAMIRQADLVLVAYQRHVGSSNVLIRAAEAGKPVLGSNFGLMGAQIHDHKLGTAVDSTNPKALAQGLMSHMDPSIPSRFDPVFAQQFAAVHDSTLYAETIFSSLGFE